MSSAALPFENYALQPRLRFESPYLLDYFGIWSIYEKSINAFASRCDGMDLFAHVRSSEVQSSVLERSTRLYPVSKDGIATFEILGPTMKAVPSMAEGTSTVLLRRQIQAARRDPEVVGAILKLDTPGGTVKGNASLAADVASFASSKPIYAFIEDMCASAGVSVASQCTKRYCESTKDLYGSMGTYGVLVDYSGHAEKLGVKVHVIKAGQHKGDGTPGTEITESQLAEMQRIVNGMNESYLQMIASGLKRSVDSIQPLADGRVLFAVDAVSVGLINGVQSFEATYSELLEECNRSKKSLTTSTVSTGKAHVELTVNPSSQPRSQQMAATLAELKSKFPKSNAEWREKQIEAGATLEEAAVNFANYVTEQSEAKEKEFNQKLAASEAKAKQDLEAAQNDRRHRNGSLGHNPIRNEKPKDKDLDEEDDKDLDEEDDSDDPVEKFNLHVSRISGRSAGLEQRQRAIRIVASKRPKLYQAYLLACNPSQKQQRMIKEKLG